MRIIGSLLIIILIFSACTVDDGLLPTQVQLPAPTTTLIPTTQAQFLATQVAEETTPGDGVPNDQPTAIPPTVEQSSPVPSDTAEPSPTEPIPPTDEPQATALQSLDPTQTLPPQILATSTQQPAVSATSTSAPTTTPIPCNVQDDWETYVVQRGDNLTNIASRAGATVDELTVANCLENPNQLRTGQEIYIPNAITTPTVQAIATNSAPTSTTVIPQDSTEPSYTVSISKTFASEIGFGLDFPAEWYVTESTTSTVQNAIITSFEYTLGDEIPQSRWSDDMVSITVTMYNTTTTDSLAEWTQSALNQFQSATNINEALTPVTFRTDSEIEGRSIDYIGSDDAIVRNYYFIINNHKVQLSIGGNFDLAESVVNSLQITQSTPPSGTGGG